MLGNFSYYNPTKLYFGDESLNYLKDELKNFGPVVLLNYGSGSVKRNGIYDIMNHIMEQYFSDFDDNTSDYLSEGLMRSLIMASRIAVKNPQDYEARSNIMWTATWALNTLIGLGKRQDRMVHMVSVHCHVDLN